MNNYRIISDIGSGAYSTVHKAIDVNTGRIVAIKMISSENMDIKHIINRQVAFLRECVDHPNIIQLEKCFSSGDFTYLIFQYMGMDLISYYKSVEESRRRKLYDEQICFISYQLCNGLKFLHEKGIMHRDIKPQNVLIDPDTLKVKLIDFGFAKLNTSSINTNYMVTRWYRPLQIVLGLPYDQKVDVFATGALILELYLGNQIFRSNSNIDQFYWITKICGNPSISWIKAQQAIKKLNLNLSQISPQIGDYLKNLRPLATDLIKKMLFTSPNQRISMNEALNHPYFSRFNAKTVPLAQKQTLILNRPLDNTAAKQQLFKNPSNKRNRAFSTQQQAPISNTLGTRQFTTRTETSQSNSQYQRFLGNYKTQVTQNQNNKNLQHGDSKKCFIKRVSGDKVHPLNSRDALTNKCSTKKLQQNSKGLRNKVKSMTGHGINVVSLKKLKIHRGIDNQKSKGKGKDEYQVKVQGQVLRLNPKKDRPMFLRVKQKINEGRLNERGQKASEISTGVSGHRGLPNQMITKIQSSAQLKIRKAPEYKEYTFKE